MFDFSWHHFDMWHHFQELWWIQQHMKKFDFSWHHFDMWHHFQELWWIQQHLKKFEDPFPKSICDLSQLLGPLILRFLPASALKSKVHVRKGHSDQIISLWYMGSVPWQGLWGPLASSCLVLSTLIPEMPDVALVLLYATR